MRRLLDRTLEINRSQLGAEPIGLGRTLQRVVRPEPELTGASGRTTKECSLRGVAIPMPAVCRLATGEESRAGRQLPIRSGWCGLPTAHRSGPHRLVA